MERVKNHPLTPESEALHAKVHNPYCRPMLPGYPECDVVQALAAIEAAVRESMLAGFDEVARCHDADHAAAEARALPTVEWCHSHGVRWDDAHDAAHAASNLATTPATAPALPRSLEAAIERHREGQCNCHEATPAPAPEAER